MHGTRRFLLAGAAALGLALVQLPPPAMARSAAMPSDFNGDGYADLAIGVPDEWLGAKEQAGAVNVLYGSRTGLTATGDQLWTQASPGVKGAARTADFFGAALASGDFNRDGYADLAIGAPSDEAGGDRTAGAVNVLYGSRRGLTAAGDQRWSRENLPAAAAADGFGTTLGSGDFDGDGFWDLAIGVHNGPVHVLYGGLDGLSATGATALLPPPVGCPAFGEALAAGDLDGDGDADLAIGAPNCTVTGGVVGVFFGTPDGLSAEGSQVWSQASPGIVDDRRVTDRFGYAVAIGDFDGDKFGDLAIGAPGDQPGRVTVLYGTSDGPTAEGSQNWHPNVPGVPTSVGRFGCALAAGDFDGDGRDDLAAGCSGGQKSGRSVIVLYGTGVGLTTAGVQRWSQDSPGVPGTGEKGDCFGASLAAANYGRSGRADLAIGNPCDAVGGATAVGRVTVLYGRTSGLAARHAQAWAQSSPGVRGTAEVGDHFGHDLTP